MPVSDDDYNVTMTSIANRLFNDPVYKEYIQSRYIKFNRYGKSFIDGIRDYEGNFPEWDSQPSYDINEHLQPKAPEKIPEGWE